MTKISSCTLSDIGKAAGVSISTASLALRHDPRIALVTRKKVQEIANQLGYKPDPMLSALIARRNRKHRAIANLAALVDNRWTSWKRLGWLRKILDGMHTACEELGYQLDELSIQEELSTISKPDRLLTARGIRGLVLLPTVDDHLMIKIDFNNFAFVVVGNSHLGRQAHRVGSDAFAGMQMTCEKLVQAGYRKVALAHPLSVETRLRYEWLGGLTQQAFHRSSPLKILPPYLPETQMQEKAFMAWFKKYRPEAIISNEECMASWLENAGFQIPRDVGIAFLNADNMSYPNPTGICQHLEASGRSAVEQIHTSLLRGEMGFPEVAKEILMRPHWSDGGSLRKV